MEVDVNELFQIIGQKEYVTFKTQQELANQKKLNEQLITKMETPKDDDSIA